MDSLIVDLVGDETLASQDSLASNGRGPDDTKRRSKVYSHFSWEDSKKKWKCKYCNPPRYYSIPAAGGTGNLTNHMRRSHASIWNKSEDNSITKHFAVVNEAPSTVPECKYQVTKEGFENRLVEFVVLTDQPFSIVEEESFKGLFSYLSASHPEVKLPSRRVIRGLIGKKYTEKYEEIKTIFHNCDSKVNFIIDCWTSANGHAFQRVVASWIDDAWKLQVAVLDMTRVFGRHTGENLALHFAKVLDNFELWDKLGSVTTDNASNMDKLFTKLDELAKEKGSNFKSCDGQIRCMAHIINLSCKAILKTVDTSNTEDDSDAEDSESEKDQPVGVIAKIRKCVKKIRRCQEARDFLRDQCTVAKVKANELILDTKTRWNSTLNMIKRHMNLKLPISLTLAHRKALRFLTLTDEEWIEVDALITILKPFRDATLLFSGVDPTLSQTLGIYEALFCHLEAYLPETQTRTSYRGAKKSGKSQGTCLQGAALAAWEKLSKYYPSADGLAYKVATMMDPRYKDKWYKAVGWRNDWIASCKHDVRKLWSDAYKTQELARQTPDDPPPKKARNSVSDKILEQMRSIQTTSSIPEDELSRYLRDPVVTQNYLEDPNNPIDSILEWWKIHQGQYSNLSKMARDHLSILGTGVPVERLFSSATDTLTHRRYRMSPASLNECLFLKSSFKLEKGMRIHCLLPTALKQMVLGEECLIEVTEGGVDEINCDDVINKL